MSNKVGVGCPNFDDPTFDELLSIGYGSYLIASNGLDDGYSLDQCQRIASRYPDALIVLRIMGGMPENVDGFLSESVRRHDAFRQVAGKSIHLIPWNEPDLAGEGGVGAEQVARFAAEWAKRFRSARPEAVLHFPAFSGERFYQNSEQSKWLPTAWEHFSVIDLHAYEAPGHEPLAYVDAYLRWWSTVAFRRPSGLIMPACITEWNHNPDLPRPPDYPERIRNFYRRCYEWLWIVAGFPFIWRWSGHLGIVDIYDPDEGRRSGNLSATRGSVLDFPLTMPVIDLTPFYDVSGRVSPPPAPFVPPAPPEPEPSNPEETAVGFLTTIYLHQFGGPGRNYREQTYEEFAQTAAQYKINEIWFKSNQGGNLSGSWDTHPLAFNTLDEIGACYDACARQGVKAVFWGVPQGDTWRADAQIALAIAERCGNEYHTDLEMFDQFWGANRWGVQDIPRYFEMLEGIVHTVSAVMRFGEPELIPWNKIVDYIEILYSQSYWHDFRQRGPEEAARVVAEDVAVMRSLTDRRIGVVCPRDGTPDEYAAVQEVLEWEQVDAVGMWVWDYAGKLPFEFLRDLPHIEEPGPPTPEPSESELWEIAYSQALEAQAAINKVVEVTTPGADFTTQVSLDEGWRASGLAQTWLANYRETVTKISRLIPEN